MHVHCLCPAEQDGADLLAHHVIGNGDHRGFRDAGCGKQCGFDLDAGNVLAATDDDVLDPVDDVHAAGVVDAHDVTGV